MSCSADSEFSAWALDFPGCAQHLPAKHHWWPLQSPQITECLITSWDWNYTHLEKAEEKNPKQKNPPKNPKQKNPPNPKKPTKPKTPWFMPQNVFAHVFKILFFTLGWVFFWIWFLFLSLSCSLKLHFSLFPSSNGSWNSLFGFLFLVNVDEDTLSITGLQGLCLGRTKCHGGF